MKKALNIFIFLILFIYSEILVLGKDEFSDNKEYLDDGVAEIGRVKLNKINSNLSDEERFLKLSDIIFSVADADRLKKRYHVEKYTELLNDARAMMIGIPGHAKYHENLVKKELLRYNDSGGISAGFYSDVQFRSFSVLGQLPSPETIQVLGDFLSDNQGGFEGIPEYPEQVIWTPVKNSDKAAVALFKLIENPPTPDKGNLRSDIDVPAWRLWYNQVKAGTRTIRFKGDPQEYNLTGPVSGSRNPDIPRASRRLGDPKSVGMTGNSPFRSSDWAPWIAGVVAVLLGLGAWVYLRKTRER